MPAYVAHPELGWVTYASIKLAGYTLLPVLLVPRANRRPWFWWIGPFRTVLGAVLGTLIGIAIGSAVSGNADGVFLAWYVLALPIVRFGEWWLTYRWFTTLDFQGLRWRSAVSIPASYLLDMPAVFFGFVISGFSVC